MALKADDIYLSSPVWVQQIAVALFGWHWRKIRFGPHFERLVSEFRERDNWTVAQFHSYQEEKLKILMAAAWNSPYYRRAFEHSGIAPDMPPFEALRSAPVLTKDTLRTNAADLLTVHPPPRGTAIYKSSGTSGTPTATYYTREFHALEMAVATARSLNWAGATHQDRRVMFGVRKICHYDQHKPPFWRVSPAENMAYASIYHLSPRFMPYYLDFLRVYQPSVIMGCPSALHTIARFALDRDLLPPKAKCIVTTSEPLPFQFRTTIEAAWQCRVYDRYGSVEGCIFASRCKFDRCHASPDVGIFDIVGPDLKPVPPGEAGEIICTGLQNTLQPLIRYRIGDVARLASDQTCSCGRSMPILEAVEGRTEDFCYTRDGRRMMRFDTVFKGIYHVAKAQVIQETLEKFTVLVMPASGFCSEDVARIKANMALHIGSSAVTVRLVDDIPSGASGKFRAVVCKMPPQEIESASRIEFRQRNSPGHLTDVVTR